MHRNLVRRERIENLDEDFGIVSQDHPVICEGQRTILPAILIVDLEAEDQ